MFFFMQSKTPRHRNKLRNKRIRRQLQAMQLGVSREFRQWSLRGRERAQNEKLRENVHILPLEQSQHGNGRVQVTQFQPFYLHRQTHFALPPNH